LSDLKNWFTITERYELNIRFVKMLNFVYFYFFYFGYSSPLAVEKRQALE